MRGGGTGSGTGSGGGPAAAARCAPLRPVLNGGAEPPSRDTACEPGGQLRTAHRHRTAPAPRSELLFHSPSHHHPPRPPTMSNLNKDTEHTNGGGNVEEEVGARGTRWGTRFGAPRAGRRGWSTGSAARWGFGVPGAGTWSTEDPASREPGLLGLWSTGDPPASRLRSPKNRDAEHCGPEGSRVLRAAALKAHGVEALKLWEWWPRAPGSWDF